MHYSTISKIREFVVRLGFYASIGDFESVAVIYRQINHLLAFLQVESHDSKSEVNDESDASCDEVPDV